MYLGGLQSEIPFLERPGQLSSDDFVGCIKSLSINGNEKNFHEDALNTSRIASTCNFNSPCSRGDECGEVGSCLPLWSRHQCSCGHEEIHASDCEESFLPFTLMEENQIDFTPTAKFQRARSLLSLYSNDLRGWSEESHFGLQSNPSHHSSLSLAFRSLQENAVILSSSDISGLSKVLIINGVLVYQSTGVGLPEINMTSGHRVNDGLWHSLKLLSDEKFTSAHKFLDRNVEKITLGFKDSEKVIAINCISISGFRGCMTNFTINQELQSPFPPASPYEHPWFKVQSPLSRKLNSGCDLNVLQSTRESQAIDIGVALVIAFFVILFTCFGCSCLAFRVRKWLNKNSVLGNKAAGQGERNNNNNNAGEESSQGVPSSLRGSGVGGNDEGSKDVMMLKSVGNKPDIIEAEDIVLHPRSTHIHDPNPSSFYDRIPEHYDLDNASSIAPSDIDVAYHYKAYRSGRKAPPFKKKGLHPLSHVTPLARLSPSSEISHNTPRILTLGDLSGKNLPPGLVDRGLSSPLSNMSRSSGKRTLTSENVARFNGAKNSSSLVNTMDLVVGSSEDPRKKVNKTPTSQTTAPSSSSSSSSDEDNDNDSFTCSEYDYDEIHHPNKEDTRPLVLTGGKQSTFSKLLGLESQSGYFRDASDEGGDDEEGMNRIFVDLLHRLGG
ncbi:Uncharacterized protein FKW44_015185, partial [Caligus rogercresseyi]